MSLWTATCVKYVFAWDCRHFYLRKQTGKRPVCERKHENSEHLFMCRKKFELFVYLGKEKVISREDEHTFSNDHSCHFPFRIVHLCRTEACPICMRQVKVPLVACIHYLAPARVPSSLSVCECVCVLGATLGNILKFFSYTLHRQRCYRFRE